MVHAQHRSNMASFSVKSFDKKLKEMSARQDSVQTVSLWLIHHRAHSKSVVNIWLDRMKKGWKFDVFIVHFCKVLSVHLAN